MTYREIVVGTDGSRTATRAVSAAARLAARLGVALTVATAWYRHLDDPPATSEEATYPAGGASGSEAMWASETATDGAAVARAAGVAVVHQVTPIGNPADALVQLGEERPGALLVVGTAGLRSRAQRLVGNVPHQLTHHASRDLLLIRSSDDDHEHRRIGLATDGSPTAALACQQGVALARRLGVEPVLLTAARSHQAGERALERARARLEGGDELEGRVAVGDHVADALVDAACGFDLLVLGNKGMSGPSRLLGSVANHVTHAVPTDLLLVNTTR